MSGRGAIGTSLHRASKLLRAYIAALKAVKSRGGSAGRPDEAGSLLAVLAPPSRHLEGRACFVLGIDGEEMSEFLRLRHRERWPSARDGMLSVESRIEGGSGRQGATVRRGPVDPWRRLRCTRQRVRVPVQGHAQAMRAPCLRRAVCGQIDGAELPKAEVLGSQRHVALERLAAGRRGRFGGAAQPSRPLNWTWGIG